MSEEIVMLARISSDEVRLIVQHPWISITIVVALIALALMAKNVK
jgi:hypothetical protein